MRYSKSILHNKWKVEKVKGNQFQESVNFDRRRRSVEFNAMGESFKLDMTPNNKLLAPYVRSIKIIFANNFFET